MVRLNLRKEIQSSPQLAVHIVTMALTYAFVGIEIPLFNELKAFHEASKVQVADQLHDYVRIASAFVAGYLITAQSFRHCYVIVCGYALLCTAFLMIQCAPLDCSLLFLISNVSLQAIALSFLTIGCTQWTMYCWGMYCAPMLLTLLTIENVSQSIYNLLLRHLDDQSSAVFALLAVFGSISAVLQCWPSLANVKHETLNPALDISIKPCIQVRFALQTLDAVCFVLQSIVRQTMTLLCTSQLPLLLHQLFPSPTFREIDRHLISVVGLVITIVVAVCLFRFSAKHVLSIQCAAMLSGYLCWASSSNEVPWIKAQFIILTAIGSIAIEATLVEYLLVHFQLPLTKWAAIQTFNIFLSCCLNLLFTRSNQDADILDISNTFSAIAANCSLLLSVFIVLLIVLRNK